jgi:hypothetical protein
MKKLISIVSELSWLLVVETEFCTSNKNRLKLAIFICAPYRPLFQTVTKTKWKMRVCDVVPVVERKVNISKKYRRSHKRNLHRRSRRKRSNIRYYTYLKETRFKRRTDDLCSAITVVDITGMDWSPHVASTTAEVGEWHKHEQIAYWKSRALSLEHENKMLIEHIRNVYAKQTEDYANYIRSQQEINEASHEKRNIDHTKSEITNLPIEPAGKKRREAMVKLYGKKASKIMGMETAVQLNYDLHVENAGKLPHWPHTPLNLIFN